MSGKILILGGGFGGVRTALDLAKSMGDRAEITLVDKNGYHLFVPALYEVAAACAKTGEDAFKVALRKTVAVPYSNIFDGLKVSYIQAEIIGIDLAGKQVTTVSGNILSYDYLVLAMGSEVSDFGVLGVREYAFQFRSIDDALLINRKINELYAKKSPDGSCPPLRIGVAGAGFSGIELAAELALTAKTLARVCGVKANVSVTLFEAQSAILAGATDVERSMICKRLNALGVGILENAAIQSVEADKVVLKSGRTVPVDMLVWTAGIRANSLLSGISELPVSERGKIIVDEYLRVLGRLDVFAVGDNIEFIDHRTERAIPSLAYLAIDHGRVTAENIFHSIYGGELQVHKPFYDAWIAPIGGKWAIARLWYGLVITGFLGWVIREVVDLRYFFGILPPVKALKFLWDEIRIFSAND